MDSKFAKHLFLKRWSVYGYRLKPWCLLFSARLEALSSPVVTGETVTATDVLIAAQVCSSHDRYCPDLSPARLRRFWFNEKKERAKLRAYIDEGSSSPDLHDPIGNSVGRGPWRAPWQHSVVAYILRHAHGITRREVWAMPEGDAFCLYHTLSEQVSGQSRIYSEEEQEADRQLVIENERNRPRDERRGRNIALRLSGKWPKEIPYDINAELPEDVYNG